MSLNHLVLLKRISLADCAALLFIHPRVTFLPHLFVSMSRMLCREESTYLYLAVQMWEKMFSEPSKGDQLCSWSPPLLLVPTSVPCMESSKGGRRPARTYKKVTGSSQHGFVDGKTCVSNLVAFHNEMTGIVDKQRAV